MYRKEEDGIKLKAYDKIVVSVTSIMYYSPGAGQLVMLVLHDFNSI